MPKKKPNTFVYVMPAELIEAFYEIRDDPQLRRETHEEVVRAMTKRIAAKASELAPSYPGLSIKVVMDRGEWEGRGTDLYSVMEDGSEEISDEKIYEAGELQELLEDAQLHGFSLLDGATVEIDGVTYLTRRIGGKDYVETVAVQRHLGCTLEHAQRLAPTIEGAFQPTGGRGRWLIPLSFFGK